MSEPDKSHVNRPRSRKQKVFAVLPTLLTLGNAACGFGAITFAAKVGPETGVTNEFLIAAMLIYLAMLFDALDGSAARWTRQTSEFGAQLDSLCDALSFGAAPAFLMLRMVQFSTSTQGAQELARWAYHPRLLWVIAVLYVVCALLRLARFNVETEEEDAHDTFSGLPSPAAAGTVASFPIAIHGIRKLQSEGHWFSQQLAANLEPIAYIALPLITLAVACLMVSRFRYAHVFNQLFRGQRGRRHLIQLVFTVAVVVVVNELAVPLVFGYFAFSAPVKWLWVEMVQKRVRKLRTGAPADARLEGRR